MLREAQRYFESDGGGGGGECEIMLVSPLCQNKVTVFNDSNNHL